MAKLTFNEERHEYSVDGVILPSVTEITKFLSVDIAENANHEMRDAAAERGRRIHEACTAYDFDGENAEIDADIIGYVEAYAKFKRDYQITDWIYYEHPMGSDDAGYAGTLDRFGIIDAVPYIVDLKTGTRVAKLEWAAQLAGYRELLEREHFDERIDCGANLSSARCAVLHLKKDGKYTFYKNLCAENVWGHCYMLYHRIKEWKESEGKK